MNAFLLPRVAGLSGQPAPSPATVAAIQQAIRAIRGAGDRALARPALLSAVEGAAATDLTDLLAEALADDLSYQGLVATLQDALAAAEGDDREFVRYNLARLYLLRARTLPSASRRPLLEAASRAAEGFDPKRKDPAVWEFQGDLALERGDLLAALERYRGIVPAGGARARMQLKIAGAYHARFQYGEAERAYYEGIRADTAASERTMTRHQLYQGLGALYLQQRREKEAAQALLDSAKVRPEEKAPYRLQLDLARRLLARGFAHEVASYCEAALRFTPDDREAEALLAAARRKRS